MDGGLDDEWEDATFIAELIRTADEAVASRNPDPLPPPTRARSHPHRELNHVSKQMNELKNECTELRKDRTKKDLQIKAKEAEIQNLKKANVDKDVHSLRDDLYLKQGQQTDLAEALELRCRTMIDNGISTSGVVSLEENTHFEPRSITCKEIKAIGVQTDKTSDNEHLECNKMNSGKISIQTFLEALLNLCAFDTAAIVGRTLRVLLRVLQHLLHHGAMSSGRNNVSVEPYVNIHMENNHKDCSTLLSPLDTEDSLRQHNMFLPFTLWSSLFTAMLQIGVKYSEETIRTDALSIMILIVRSTDPKEERHKFGFTSVMTRLHLLLQKENGLLVKKHSVRLLFLLLNCPVSARGASFLEMIMEVLASQMQYETQELLKERCLVMREALILLNRLASHTNYSKPTLEVLTRSKICAILTIDVANRLPQTRMANDLAELAQKFRSRVYAFLEEKPLIVEGSNLSASNKS
ncbi:unnamed protein product [Miscanthus lutarioriparius]|uniref:Uncharacterized protein n=1 Tax=Miscanthus lutarioriparius TaxID=422564 RepID=A0A811SLH3_9POAL|nr:unnamed protein product [Miscanthus lutarioriparius]